MSGKLPILTFVAGIVWSVLGANSDPGVWTSYQTDEQWGWRHFGILTNETYGWAFQFDANTSDVYYGGVYDLPPHTCNLTALAGVSTNSAPLLFPDAISPSGKSWTCTIGKLGFKFSGNAAAAACVSEMAFPAGTRKIMEQCFQGCSNATGVVTFPGALELINAYAFASCKNIAISTANGSGTNITALGAYAFQSVPFDGHACFPAVQTIAGRAFYNSPITSVEFGPALTQMNGGWQSGTFENCRSLTNVVFSEESQWKLSGGINFLNCSSLKELTLSGCYWIEHIEEGNNYCGYTPFNGTPNLKKLVFSPKLNRTSRLMFRNSSVTEVWFQGKPPEKFGFPYLVSGAGTDLESRIITTHVPYKLLEEKNAVGTNWLMLAANNVVKVPGKGTTFAADFVSVTSSNLAKRPLVHDQHFGICVIFR